MNMDKQDIQDFVFRLLILSILSIHVNNGPHSKALHQHPRWRKAALTLRD
jgi:hypothetical protein